MTITVKTPFGPYEAWADGSFPWMHDTAKPLSEVLARGGPLFRAGCLDCDDRPLCRICLRPRQEGSPNRPPEPGMIHVPEPCQGPEPYRRGLLWHFDSEAELTAWEAWHEPFRTIHPNSWSLRVR